jgi:hypothetical protein
LFGFSEYNPGEDMCIAIRRPDGAWHFTDSHTPFTYERIRNRCHCISYIHQIDSQLALLLLKLAISFQQSQRGKDCPQSDDFGFRVNSTALLPPAYHHEPPL